MSEVNIEGRRYIAGDNEQSGYLNMELLRFTTAGSVDDGKSTLIGRLLYDSKAIFQDQLDAIEQASQRRGEEGVNLALLTDGLRAEREQGITIDVAYRYFATPKRKFIIADTPGHIQYTRNMVTGASTADAAIILIDARNGVVEQTLRHSFIASLLTIPHVIVCINKMDMVNFSEKKFEEIRTRYIEFSGRLRLGDIRFIPICAKYGDNVVDRSERMPWYIGSTLMDQLENIPVDKSNTQSPARFPVQHVIRPQNNEYHDYRGYAGRMAGGTFKPGDPVVVLPSGFRSHIEKIDFANKTLNEAFAPQSVNLLLEHDLDISRGDMIVQENNPPRSEQEMDLMICWLNEKPMTTGGKYTVRHTSSESRCIIKDVKYKVNINTLEENAGDKHIGLNDIARITIRTSKPLFVDSYSNNRITGSLILIDDGTHETVCAGMII